MFTTRNEVRHRVWLAALIAAAVFLLFAAAPATGEEITHVQVNSNRAYPVTNLPSNNFTAATSAKVEVWAAAICGCAFDPGEGPPNPSQSGYYITITRPPSPPAATTVNLSVDTKAEVPHASGEARQSLVPHVDIVDNTAHIEINVTSSATTHKSKCPDGWSDAFAGFKPKVDPIIFGSASYIGYTGLSLDPFPTDHDGVHRYIEQELKLLDGTGFLNAKPGVTPGTNGLQPTNRMGLYQIVRAGSDDDPDNESGTLMYSLVTTIAPDGDFVVTWTPNTGTADFAFTFDQTPAQIEQAVHDYLKAGTGGDLPVVTARVTLLQNESTMPNVTLLGLDEAEAWIWESGDPNRVEWPTKYWQGPDVLGASRLSTKAPPLPEVRLADDFTLNTANPVYALRWYGSHHGEVGWHSPNVTTYSLPFEVFIYHDAGGVPGAVAMHYPDPMVKADRFFVHWMPSSNEPLYEHNARLCPPFIPTPGQSYFLSIVDPNMPNWAWVDAKSALGSAPLTAPSDAGPWTPSGWPDDASFMLLGAGAEVDHDCDADVDDVDYIHQADCMAGPNQTPAPSLIMTPQQCLATYDMDQDGDVDLRDHQEFAVLFTGPF